MHVCVCVCVCVDGYAWNQKVYSSEVYVCPLAERVCLYMRGNVEIQEKWNSLNDDIHVNLDTANVFSIAVSSPMFCGCVSAKLSVSSCLELWDAPWGELRVRQWDLSKA